MRCSPGQLSTDDSTRWLKRDRGTLLDLLIMCERPERRQTFPFSLGRCHAVTEGYEAARPGAFLQTTPAGTKKRPGNTPRSLKNVRATETATDVSVLPREMSRSDRGVRGREAWSVFQNSYRRRQKKRPKNTPRSLKNVRAKGLEPIRTKAPDPKSGLATNYNTLANPFRKTHNMKPIAEYNLVGSCRILCPKRNAKIVKDFQFSKPVRIFAKNTEKKYDICASKKTNRKNRGPELETKTG